ncbi:cytochrome c-type biogenesis protein CcmH [Litorilinea aerophila]|uniref:Cytochrome c-type biogenesis protein n=1 Tax=Litorilinea aerophila TaxID=1204385 RepID=A0A540VM36_9CHLR|nr:cytochrome c-type biogenesis protein [Litorilinea aerophila]MCC9074521.1 cytochrome c-type biogenesis protein CcmH [Litorilinea aerophila]GIV75665.1 MAG: hypothetical protein KatS3mg050_0059 [Litorilinea sp.]
MQTYPPAFSDPSPGRLSPSGPVSLSPWGRPWVALAWALFLGLIWLGLATPAWAQDATPPDVDPNQINAVARELWCPLCSGVRLDSCELKACEQMRDVIALKLAAGEDPESIKAYFVEQYGPQVLGEPPRQGFNWLAWILPVVAAVGGGLFVWRKARQMVRPATVTAPLPTSTADNRPGDGTADEDEYARKLEEELARYG